MTLIFDGYRACPEVYCQDEQLSQVAVEHTVVMLQSFLSLHIEKENYQNTTAIINTANARKVKF